MKRIKITEQQQEQILQKFQQMLMSGRFSDGRIKFDEPLDKVLDNIQKPTLMFTAIAWLKMRQLINDATGEIGWHGIVEHTKGSSIYLIKDLLLYPQTVTGATVTTDELEYATWLMHFDDQIFNRIRFQGHSHVNFSTNPSGVDTHFYDSILQNLQEDDYYIFMIMNKRADLTIIMYDFSQNVVFDEKDVTIKIACKHGDIESWAKDEIKNKVKTYTYTKKDEIKEPLTTIVAPPGVIHPHKPISEMTDQEYFEYLKKNTYFDDDEVNRTMKIYPYEEKRGPGRPKGGRK